MNNLIINPRCNSYLLPVINDFKQKIDLQGGSWPHNQECLIDAHNDLQAAQSWLNQYSNKNTTFLRYKREADRFLLWCIYEAGEPLSQLKIEDFTKYIEFLGNPPVTWCTSVGATRLSGHGKTTWRPFLGPLSNSAKATAIKIVNSLMNYLVDSLYLRANPLKLIKQKSKFDIKSEEYKYSVWAKILDDQEWQALQATLESMPEDTDFAKENKSRMQFIFACMYLLGLRISELATSTWSAFKLHQGCWWFFVRGKGDKLGHIPVNDQLLEIIKGYRSSLGKDLLPKTNEMESLIVSKKTREPLSIKQIYSLIKDIGVQTAQKFAVDSISHQKLLALSPHSLRHLSASHQSKAGIPMQIIKENLRHSSSQTTQIYIHVDDHLRHEFSQDLKLSNISCYDVKKQKDETILTITIKRSPSVTSQKSFAMFVQAITNFKINGVTIKPCKPINEMLLEFDAVRKFGSEYELNYLLDFLQRESTVMLKEYIGREADIRFFKVNVKFGSEL